MQMPHLHSNDEELKWLKWRRVLDQSYNNLAIIYYGLDTQTSVQIKVQLTQIT